MPHVELGLGCQAPFLAWPSSPRPNTAPAASDRESPFASPRMPKTAAYPIAFGKVQDKERFKTFSRDLHLRSGQSTAEHRYMRASATATRDKLMATTTLQEREESQRALLQRRNAVEPPGTPRTPRNRIGPRDARAPQSRELCVDTNVAAQVLRARAEVDVAERQDAARTVATIQAQKVGVERAAQARAVKQKEVQTQATNLRNRVDLIDLRKTLVEKRHKNEQEAKTALHTKQAAAAVNLKARIREKHAQMLEARTRAWKLQISSGAELSRWNEERARTYLRSPRSSARSPQVSPRSPRTPESRW